MEQLELWLKFLLAAGIVISAGLSLTTNAEKLSGALGWGHAFAGFVILGWATSLPEVTISVSAVLDVHSAGLSAGNITGSVIFNLAILALLGLLLERTRVPVDVSGQGVMALGTFNTVMLGGALLFTVSPLLTTGALSRLTGVFLLGVYVLATLWLWWRERRSGGDDGGEEQEEEAVTTAPPGTTGALFLRCLLAGGVILGAGIWLAKIGDEMADVYQLEESFVGTLFLAAVSSLPELVTGVAAIRMGLLTMCVGSILGSNIFNMGILGACDLLWQGTEEQSTAMLAAADDPRLLFNLATGLGLTGLAMLSVKLRRIRARRRILRAVSIAMLAGYAIAIAPSSSTVG